MHKHTNMHVHTNTLTHASTYKTHTHTHTHTHKHTHIYSLSLSLTHTHTHTHTYTHRSKSQGFSQAADQTSILCTLLDCGSFLLKPSTCSLKEESGGTVCNQHMMISYFLPVTTNILTHFVPQTRISRFDHDVASTRKRETLVLDQYFRFCVSSVGVTAPN